MLFSFAEKIRRTGLSIIAKEVKMSHTPTPKIHSGRRKK
jgi:hypothetical protein